MRPRSIRSLTVVADPRERLSEKRRLSESRTLPGGHAVLRKVRVAGLMWHLGVNQE